MGVCPDTCKEVGARDRAERLEEASKHEKGAAQRLEYIRKAVEKQEANRSLKAKLQAELVTVEKEASELSSLKDSPWLKEARTYEEARSDIEIQNRDTDTPQEKAEVVVTEATGLEAMPSTLNANERHALPASGSLPPRPIPEVVKEDSPPAPNANEKHALLTTTADAGQPNQLSHDADRPTAKAEPISESIAVTELKYDAPQRSGMSIGQGLESWVGVPWVRKPAFKRGDGTVASFEPHSGGAWSGDVDHSVSVAFAWHRQNLFVAIEVTDDSHENTGSPWDGDSVQIAITDAAREMVSHLYNVALSEDGKIIKQSEMIDGKTDGTIHYEEGSQGQTGISAQITRVEATGKTVYKIRLPVASLGRDRLRAQDQISIGICVNDGDKALGQEGQKGWSGWGPHAIVHGRRAKEAGLITLAESSEIEELPPANHMIPDDDGAIEEEAKKK